MTCFWDGLTQSLLRNKIIPNTSDIRNPRKFVNYLKKHNTKTINVKWNNEILTTKQLQENYDHINELDSNRIGQGYLCSTCDPFLFLVSELFQVDIDHNYCSHIMKYTYIPPENKKILYLGQENINKKVLRLSNNRRHLWIN